MIPTALSLGILLAVFAYILNQLGFRGVRAFAALGLAAIMLSVSVSAGEGFSEIGRTCALAEISEVARPAVKVVFLGYIFGFCSDIATELGEGGIANALTFGGRIEMVLVALPYINDIVELAVELV